MDLNSTFENKNLFHFYKEILDEDVEHYGAEVGDRFENPKGLKYFNFDMQDISPIFEKILNYGFSLSLLTAEQYLWLEEIINKVLF